MWSCSQLEAGAMAEESCQGAVTAFQSRQCSQHSSCPLQSSQGPARGQERNAGLFPSSMPLLCLFHYVEVSERMVCFFKAQGVSSLWRPCHRLSVVCNPQWTFVGAEVQPVLWVPDAVQIQAPLSWPQQCGASVISVDVQRTDIRWHFLSTVGDTDCSTQTRYKNLPSLASASPCLILPRFLKRDITGSSWQWG